MSTVRLPVAKLALGRVLAASCIAVVVCMTASAASASAENVMVLQPDGKVAIAGLSEHAHGRVAPTLVRFNADGSADRGFGAGGALVDFRTGSSGFESLAYLGGDLLAAQSGDDGVGLFRYDSEGTPVRGFGVAGIADSPASTTGLEPTAIVPLTSGSLAVSYTGPLVGKYREGPLAAGALSFAADGGFAETIGELSAAPGSERRSVSVADSVDLGDGSLAIVGSMQRPDGVRGLLARLVPGSHVPDPSFGGGQELVTLPGATSPQAGQAASAAAVTRAGGRLIVAGSLNGGIGVFRFSEDGKPDLSFGEAGAGRMALELSHEAIASAVAVQPDGKILVAGRTVDYKSLANPIEYEWNLVLARFNQDGSPDTSFGTNGYVRFASPNLPAPEGGTYLPGPVDLALQNDGKVLLSEAAGGRYQSRFVLARYTADGRPDTTFGSKGQVSLIPCLGTLHARRAAGCISRARANLSLRGLRSGRPHGHLRLSASSALDPISSARIILPPALRGRPGSAAKVRVRTNFGHSVSTKLDRGGIFVSRMGSPTAVRIAIAGGAVRTPQPIAKGQRVFVHVVVSFKDGSSQRRRLRAH